jgi:hypothetical protein
MLMIQDCIPLTKQKTKKENLFASIASLQVFLERRCLRDTLAWVLVLLGLRVAGIVHATSSLLGGALVEDSASTGEGNRGRAKGRSASHKGSEKDHLGLLNERRDTVLEKANAQLNSFDDDALFHTYRSHCLGFGLQLNLQNNCVKSNFGILRRTVRWRCRWGL